MAHYDVLLDVSGEACPMPLLKAKMALNQLEVGQCLKVVATDAGSVRDFSAFIKLTPHDLSEDFSNEGSFIYYIKKGS